MIAQQCKNGFLDRLPVQIIIDICIVCEADGTVLLRYDYDDSIAVLGKAKGCGR